MFSRGTLNLDVVELAQRLFGEEFFVLFSQPFVDELC